jgi:argininosuccinate synthase
MTSPYSLYSEQIASFGEDDSYDQNDSAGFINLFGLPIKVAAMQEVKRKQEEKKKKKHGHKEKVVWHYGEQDLEKKQIVG